MEGIWSWNGFAGLKQMAWKRKRPRGALSKDFPVVGSEEEEAGRCAWNWDWDWDWDWRCGVMMIWLGTEEGGTSRKRGLWI